MSPAGPADTRCPTCGHVARTYRRALTSVAARAVIALYRVHGTEPGHLPTIARNHLADCAHQGGYLALAGHWGLIEEERRFRPDGGRAGYWRVTPLGWQWLTCRTTVAKYAVIREGDCIALEGPQITVIDALGEHFDLESLLGPPPPPFPPRGRGPAAPIPLFDATPDPATFKDRAAA